MLSDDEMGGFSVESEIWNITGIHKEKGESAPPNSLKIVRSI